MYKYKFFVLFLITEIDVQLVYNPDKSFTVHHNGQQYNVTGTMQQEEDRNRLVCCIDGNITSSFVIFQSDSVHLFNVVSLPEEHFNNFILIKKSFSLQL